MLLRYLNGLDDVEGFFVQMVLVGRQTAFVNQKSYTNVCLIL